MFSRMFIFFSTLETVTKPPSGRPTVSWQALLVCSFRRYVSSKWCVHHPICPLSVLTIIAETRVRAIPENRCEAWGKGVCLRQNPINHSPLHVRPCQRYFSYTQHWQYLSHNCIIRTFSKSSRYGVFLHHVPLFNLFSFSVTFRIQVIYEWCSVIQYP